MLLYINQVERKKEANSMFEYINVGKRILKILNNNGYEAYFVGESVRNSLLEKTINKVDITTNASIDSIKKLFLDCIIEDINEYLILLCFGNYNFYVNTFYHITNKEVLFYDKHYSKNLIEDLFCRDFTINAVAMSHSGKVSDPLNGHADIIKKRIRHIGNGKKRFSENPELMIKAFALMSELNYNLANKTKREINKRRKKILDCDVDLYIEYLKNVFEGQYAKKAIRMMNKVNLDLVLPVFKNTLRFLDNHRKSLSFQEVLLISFLLNGTFDKRYEKYIEDVDTFNKVYIVALLNKKCNYDDITLFSYGLDICLEANRMNTILRRSRKKTRKIKKSWENLKIKTPNDLLFNEVDIKRIISPKDYFIIEDILMDASVAVLSGEIKNTFTEIQSVVVKLLIQNNIEYNLNGFIKCDVQEENEVKKVERHESDLDIINQYLINNQKNNTEEESINELVDVDLKYLEESKKIQELMKNDKKFASEFKKFMANYIEDEKKEGDDE